MRKKPCQPATFFDRSRRGSIVESLDRADVNLTTLNNSSNGPFSTSGCGKTYPEKYLPIHDEDEFINISSVAQYVTAEDRIQIRFRGADPACPFPF